MASLFGRNRLRERAEKIETSEVVDHIAVVQTWLDDYDHGTLKKDKEISRAPRYNADFFMKILGYKDKPATPHTFEAEHTTSAGQFPDGTLRYTDASVDLDRVFAVVELKGAAISLDRPQQRAGNLSPVQQAFKYKPQYSSCPFVVVSNFFEFRLYNDNQLDYEVWTLRDLVDPADDYLKFKQWYVLLHADNMVAVDGKSATEKLLSDIRQKQEEIGKEFYADYKRARTALLQDIWRKNEKTRFQFDVAIQKAQTIVDRIVFSCFAEDSGLLPDNTLARVGENAKSSPYNDSLWDELKDFFTKVDRGSSKLGIPQGYSGGLFAYDPMIDALEISDGPLEKLVALGGYNFAEDLRVNILGHIFEQSITDLEEIKRRAWADKHPFEPEKPELEVGRRKREGVYYTPDYIVRYIVQSTVGAYLLEKEDELKVKHRLTGRLGERGYEERQLLAYTEYQYILQNLKVLDPACGSGAFLVAVFDYLLAENQRVDDIIGGNLTSVDDFVRSILSDNIFGVDINEESVEITKLSLWLKTAKKDQPLTSLDDNIKCGNSLFSDETIAGDNAFDWDASFPVIMSKGGFDVIVGNPPWGAEIPHEIRGMFRKLYPVIEKQVEIYMAFLAKGTALLKDFGYLSYITPSTWLAMHYYKKLRRHILDTSEIKQAILLTYQVFEDVTAETSIVVLKKAKAADGALVSYSVVRSFEEFDRMGFNTVAQSVWSDRYLQGFNLTTSGTKAKLIDKLFSGKPLSSIVEVKNGMKPYCTGKGDPLQTKEMVKARLYDATEKLSEKHKNYIVGKHIHQFWIDPSDMWIEYGDNLAEPRGFSFEQPKIVMRQTSDKIVAAYDGHGLYNLNNVHNLVVHDDQDVDLKAIAALLNSKVVDFLYNFLVPEQGRVFAEVKGVNVKKIPLPVESSLSALNDIYDEVVTATKAIFDASQKFQKVITAEYSVVAWPSRLGDWWTWDYATLIKNLKIKVSLRNKAELVEYFEENKMELEGLAKQLDGVRVRLDELVYKAYKLDKAEIALVESLE